MFSKKSKKVFAVLLTLALLLGMGVSNVWAGSVHDNLIPNHDVSLTVNKLLTTVPSTEPGNGMSGPSDLDPAPGVVFTLTKLLTVDENTTVENCKGDENNSNVDTNFGENGNIQGTTDSNGIIEWTKADGLVQGYYLLEETYSPYNGIDNGILAFQAAPSIITLPYANDSEYIYDVKVYPKNVGDVNAKTVRNPQAIYKPGDTVEWEIKTIINSQFSEYKITDTLDERLSLSYTGRGRDRIPDVVVRLVVNGTEQRQPLRVNSDYAVSFDAETKQVTVTLLEAGLAKVKQAGATAIKTVIKTEVNNSAFTDKAFMDTNNDVIINGAQLTYNTGDGPSTIDLIPSAVNLANLDLSKVNKDGDMLSGAEFKIAATERDAQRNNFMKDGNGNDIVLTSSEEGKIYASGVTFSQDKSGEYAVYLVETKAPENYVLPQKQFFKVVLNPQDGVISVEVPKTNTEADPFAIDYVRYIGADDILNTNGFTLPITGGAGTIIFTVVGLVLILSASIILFKTRKKAAVK